MCNYAKIFIGKRYNTLYRLQGYRVKVAGMKTIYCTEFETMSDTIDILLADGYEVTVRYSGIIINNAEAYEITYGETNTVT